MANRAKERRLRRQTESLASYQLENAPEMNDAMVETKSDGKRKRWFDLNVRGNLLTIGVVALLSLGALGAGLKYMEDSAKQQKAGNANKLNEQGESYLNKINLFVEPPPPSPTPQLSKEFLYAGSRLLAVEDANANAAPPADLAIWRPSTGVWWVLGGTGS